MASDRTPFVRSPLLLTAVLLTIALAVATAVTTMSVSAARAELVKALRHATAPTTAIDPLAIAGPAIAFSVVIALVFAALAAGLQVAGRRRTGGRPRSSPQGTRTPNSSVLVSASRRIMVGCALIVVAGAVCALALFSADLVRLGSVLPTASVRVLSEWLAVYLWPLFAGLWVLGILDTLWINARRDTPQRRDDHSDDLDPAVRSALRARQ